ncbi:MULTISPECIES: glycosyltransferase family 1 protein [Bosea]|uniref:glycosyltransferase family 4 protein n=1 Tax=Bosea TaxID=85413 RepID=UPI0027E249C3|nr:MULTISPECIES: glycosyltransferase family 1 protein [Bosea]MDR6830864.1 glycosyltransferase involved in cell wall biosynthesis [Bosea robiniae]MDR6897648.1 glycosyltransferase involved in cell wall biosynthesis [Bosea sp. BE109]MDR7141045.1 glycosyltransferase involved in cell wall biosynthesis [Bosea sp. BE168]MDR7177645.1 glycosyltransferase involved in cell wall biosynthesis [Bosea sp. BE271]
MRVLVATDAWRPQVNGVVRSLEQMIQAAPVLGITAQALTPEGFHQVGLPSYPDIRLALATRRMLAARISDFAPDHIHIATEGPIGWLTRAVCLAQKRPFTTSYHTRFPQYIAARWPIPESWSYRLLRRFHGPAAAVMVSTATVEEELRQHGFEKLVRWGRGVDLSLFHPRPQSLLDLPRPIFLYVGRVAVEKNVEAFLSLKLPGSKVVVGDGPARADLERAFPEARFLGLKEGEELAGIYASSDVFVFPSLTDTFGIVLLEAAASGLPVAAFPVQGPRDVFAGSAAAVLDEDLRSAAMQALRVPREACLELAARHSWAASAAQFYGHIRRVAREAGYFPREPEPATTTTLTAFASGRGGEGRGLPQRLPA